MRKTPFLSLFLPRCGGFRKGQFLPLFFAAVRNRGSRDGDSDRQTFSEAEETGQALKIFLPLPPPGISHAIREITVVSNTQQRLLDFAALLDWRPFFGRGGTRWLDCRPLVSLLFFIMTYCPKREEEKPFGLSNPSRRLRRKWAAKCERRSREA